jgi:hypothetical protein
MKATDHFQLLLIVDFETYTTVYTSNAQGTGKAHASATLDLGSKNRFAQLLSITFR